MRLFVDVVNNLVDLLSECAVELVLEECAADGECPRVSCLYLVKSLVAVYAACQNNRSGSLSNKTTVQLYSIAYITVSKKVETSNALSQALFALLDDLFHVPFRTEGLPSMVPTKGRYFMPFSLQ